MEKGKLEKKILFYVLQIREFPFFYNYQQTSHQLLSYIHRYGYLRTINQTGIEQVNQNTPPDVCEFHSTITVIICSSYTNYLIRFMHVTTIARFPFHFELLQFMDTECLPILDNLLLKQVLPMDAAILNISYAHGAVHLLEQLYDYNMEG